MQLHISSLSMWLNFGLSEHSSTSLAYAIIMNWLNGILSRPNKINPVLRVTRPYLNLLVKI